MAARGKATTTGFTLFAKNSDRERNEAQFLEMLPAQSYGAGARLRRSRNGMRARRNESRDTRTLQAGGCPRHARLLFARTSPHSTRQTKRSSPLAPLAGRGPG